MQGSAFNEDTAPDNFAGLADALERTAAKREVHGRLTLAACARVAVNKMIGWRGARDLQNPHEVVDTVAFVVLAPAHIVQRGGWIEAESIPAAIGDERIHAGTLVHFVKVRQRRTW